MAELETLPRDSRQDSRPSAVYGLVTALVVAVLVAFFLVSIPIYAPLLWGPSSQPPPEPELAFSPVDLDSEGNASWSVGGVAGGPYSYGGFLVRLAVNGESMIWVPLGLSDSSNVLVVGSLSYRVVWTDDDANGSVSPGDRFLLTGDGTPLPSSSTFEFVLKWLENWISNARWSTS